MRRLLGFVFLLFVSFIFPSIVSAQVIINEFSSDSTSPDWVEIYNNSGSDVDLSLYKLVDKANNNLPLSGILVSESFRAFDWSNRLNKDGDIIYLVRISDSQNLDVVSYGVEGGVCAPSASESVGRVDNGNVIDRFSVPTKDTTNIGAILNPCPTPTPDPTNSPTPSQTPAPTPTPSPTPTPTKSPTPVPIKSPTPKPTETPEVSAYVLGEEAKSFASETPVPESVVGTNGSKKFPFIAIVFIGSGLVLIIYSVLQLLRVKKSAQTS